MHLDFGGTTIQVTSQRVLNPGLLNEIPSSYKVRFDNSFKLLRVGLNARF
jgi:hypothetical protein